MSALQIAVLGGGLVGLGLTLLIGRLLPAQVDSRWAIEQLDPSRATTAAAEVAVTGFQDRIGLLIQRRAPSSVGFRVPVRELAILRRPVHVYFGEKGLLALVGLMFPPAVMLLAALGGISLPFALPAIASLGLAVLFWFAPDLRIKGEAEKARNDFVRALATYIDLVALERASGSGTTQSLETAAQVGDSWAFARISEELARARWSGQAPWDGLKELGEELDVPEIVDLAEIMRLSREEGATIYTQLRARASSIRNALLSEDLAKASAASEQLSVPVSMLALVFLALLATPSVLRIMG